MNKMFNFNGMPYKRSGRAGGKSVSMIGMLVLLLAALLVLPSCDDETEVEVETIICNGEEVESRDDSRCEETTTTPGGMYDKTLEDGGDEFVGGDLDESVAGGDGDDTIDGMGGNDTLNGMAGNDTVKGGAGNDMLMGGDGNDVLDGGDDNDMLDGGDGDDELIGGAGSNALDGGAGTDIVIYKYATRVRINLMTSQVTHVTDAVDPFGGGTATDTVTNVENVKGSHGNDIINGDNNANLLKGLDGADTINGHGGDDTIIPNRPANPGMDATTQANVSDTDADGTTTPAMDGADVVSGGAGSDTISYEGEALSVTVNLSMALKAADEDDPDTLM